MTRWSERQERITMSDNNFARRMLMAAVGCGAALVVTAVPAQAQPPGPAPAPPAPAPAPAPPNCTAADLAGVMSGVTASTSAYLFTHPPVNDFFTSLKGQTADQKKAALQAYLAANPQVQAELQAIRQPAVDFRNRCGGSSNMSNMPNP
jgi:heme-binding protein